MAVQTFRNLEEKDLRFLKALLERDLADARLYVAPFITACGIAVALITFGVANPATLAFPFGVVLALIGLGGEVYTLSTASRNCP